MRWNGNDVNIKQIGAEWTPTDEDLQGVVSACREFIGSRFPEPSAQGAAAMLLGNGMVVTGTAPEAVNPSVELCHEVGPYCDAFRIRQPVMASVCLHRSVEGVIRVLSPCGVCLERLAIHGASVLVGVPQSGDPGSVHWVQLRDALPHYWMLAFPEELTGW